MPVWLERVKGALLVIGLVLGALISMFFRGRAAGKEAERQQRDEQVNKQAAQARQEVRDVEQETARMGDDAIADDLKHNWVRGPGKGGG